MTKDEFLDRFIASSGMPKSCRTPDGIKDGSFERVAVACECGGSSNDRCPGWQLVKPETRQKIVVR